MWGVIRLDQLARLPQAMRNSAPLAARAKEPANSDVAEGWKKCIDRLLEIRLLEDDWDGQGSPAPEVELVDSAMILAVLLRQHGVKPPRHVVLDVQGSVNFHWRWSDNTTFDIDVTEPYLADAYLLAPAVPVEHWQLGEGVSAA